MTDLLHYSVTKAASVTKLGQLALMLFVQVGRNPGWDGTFSTIKMGSSLHKRLM